MSACINESGLLFGDYDEDNVFYILKERSSKVFEVVIC
jgi:hypothetical protein